MNKNNLKRYLLAAGKVEFIISDTEPEITAVYKNFTGTAMADDTAFSTVGGRMSCMQKAFETLIECILDTEKLIYDIEIACNIQHNIDEHEDYKNNLH